MKIFKDILEKLKEKEPNHSVSELIYRFCGDHVFTNLKDVLSELNLEYEHKYIETDDHELCYGVFKLDNVYYKAEWYIYSRSGEMYDDCYRTVKVVTPIEKTITVFE